MPGARGCARRRGLVAVVALIVIPDLGGDEYLAAFEAAAGDRVCHAGLVAVHRGRVDHPVAGLECMKDGIGGVFRGTWKTRNRVAECWLPSLHSRVGTEMVFWLLVMTTFLPRNTRADKFPPTDTVILAIDQGTTGTTCLVFDCSAELIGRRLSGIRAALPAAGLGRARRAEIWEVTQAVAGEALADAGLRPGELEAVGITNQRETVCVWDPATGEPLHRAIVWQDRRTAARCAQLRAAGTSR